MTKGAEVVEYTYHSQYHALECAAAIPPVPEDYPVNPSLPEGFREDFSALCDYGRRMYRHMAEEPARYELDPMDAHDLNHGRLNWGPVRLARESTRRAVHALYAAAWAATLRDGAFHVDGPLFRAQAKEQKLTRAGEVLEALRDTGLILSGYSPRCEAFTLSCPGSPGMLRALKGYCELRMPVLKQEEWIKADIGEFKDQFYLFDYKYTADLPALDERYWLNDQVRLLDEKARAFVRAFYDAMGAFAKVRYAGDFFVGKKCIAKLRYEDDAWKHRIDSYTVPEYREIIFGAMKIYFALILPMRITGDPNRFQTLPEHVAAHMIAKKCQNCEAFASQKAKNGGVCPHTVNFNYGGNAHRSCSYFCYHFENPDIVDLPAYIELMRKEFKLK